MVVTDKIGDDPNVPLHQCQLTIQEMSTEILRFVPAAGSGCFGKLAPFHAIWATRRTPARLPVWRDFSFRDFAGWHSHMALSDITIDEPDPRFRLFGQDMREAHDADYTGQHFTAFASRAYQDGYRDHFLEICRHGLIGYSRGAMLMEGRTHRQYEVVELPLVDNQNRVVQLLHGFLSELKLPPIR